MSHVTVSQAKPSAAALPAEAQQVTLEISDRLPGHTLYKYSMRTKDKPDTCSGGEGGGGRRAGEGVVMQLNIARKQLWLRAALGLERSRLKDW